MAYETQRVEEVQVPPRHVSGIHPASKAIRATKDFFWMHDQVARAQTESFGPERAGWKEFVLARAAVADAKVLADRGEGLGSALLLVRSAVVLLVRAHRDHLGIELNSNEEVEECLAQRFERYQMSEIGLGFSSNGERFMPDLAFRGEEDLARLSEAQVEFAAASMLELAHRLAAPFEIDINRVKKARARRWTRIAMAAAVVMSIAGVVWHKVTYRPNLALNKYVTVETSDPTWGKDPKGLVDGNLKELAFHTIGEANQRATIDLGALHRISRVVVYNRADCCQERAVPLKIDVSEDGNTFKEVMRRTEPFTKEWKANFSPVNARYVRLVDLSANYFHLNEVEVY